MQIGRCVSQRSKTRLLLVGFKVGRQRIRPVAHDVKLRAHRTGVMQMVLTDVPFLETCICYRSAFREIPPAAAEVAETWLRQVLFKSVSRADAQSQTKDCAAGPPAAAATAPISASAAVQVRP